VRSALGPESAADVGRDHTHTVGGEPEHRGYGLTDRVHTLRRVVHGERGGGVVTVPHRHRGVWFQGVVVGHRGRVGGFDRSGRVVERRVRIAGEGIGGVVRVHRFGFVEVIT